MPQPPATSPGGAFDIQVGEIMPPEIPEAMVTLGPPEGDRQTSPGFYDNLADLLSDSERSGMATRLIEDVERDIRSREPYDRVLAKGMMDLGFDREMDTRNNPFPGASAVTHPLLAQACVDFQARAIKELFPANGPVKTRVVGQYTDEKAAKAERGKEYMNWQLTVQMPEYRTELDEMLMMLPLTGNGFKKVYFDEIHKRPRSEVIGLGDMIVPYSATSLDTAVRATHRMLFQPLEVKRYQKGGLWRDVPLVKPSEAELQSRAKQQSDDIEGKQREDTGEDDRHTIYEIHTDILVPGVDDEEDLPSPYIVTVEKDSRAILAIRRNWQENDPLKQRRIWFVHYRFVPWQGFYGIGLLHLIGGLSRAATGALRALMDSAAIANMPGGIMLGDARPRQSNVTIKPLEWHSVTAPGVDDVRKVAMPFPVAGPNVVLFQLLGFLVTAGQQFAQVVNTAEANPNEAAAALLARIEQGSIVYSAIHARLHYAQGIELGKIGELNFEHLDDQVTAKTFNGELLASYRDFDDEVDVIPVSDPNIFSQVQRSAQAQAALQLAQQAQTQGVPVNMPLAFKNVAQTLNLPHAEELFPEAPQAQPLDPVSELMALQQGMPVKAFPGQAHEAHVMFLQNVAQDPSSAPLMQMIGPRLMALAADHTTWAIRDRLEAMVGPLPPPGAPMPPVVMQRVAQAVAEVQAQITGQHLQAAQQAQGGADGGLTQVAMADVQRKAAKDEAEMALKRETATADAAAEGLKIASNERIAATKEATARELEMIRQEGETIRQQMRDEALAHREFQEDTRDAAFGAQGNEVKVST